MTTASLKADDFILALDLVAHWQIEKIKEQKLWEGWEMHVMMQKMGSIGYEEDSDGGSDEGEDLLETAETRWEGLVFKRTVPGSAQGETRLGMLVRDLRLEIDIVSEGYVMTAWALTETENWNWPPSIHRVSKRAGFTKIGCNQINYAGVCPAIL